MDCHLVDAFAAGPFTGNPAAVCLLDGERATSWMQALAAELNQSETAFLRRRDDGGWDLRWFTPRVEVDLCGHATLAAAQVLFELGREPGASVAFHTRSGILTCRRLDGDALGLDLPLIPTLAVAPPEDLDHLLGARLIGAWTAGPDLIVEVDDAATVRGLRPDLVALADLDLRGVGVTAAGDDGIHDCISRFFAPRVGIPEDPVTGSVHAALAPLWCRRLRRETLVAFQASARGGRLDLRVVDDRVHLAGRCHTILRGRIAP